MAVYFYVGAKAAEAMRNAVLAFTHGDTFKPLAGYKTFVNHFHLDFTGRLPERLARYAHARSGRDAQSELEYCRP